MARDKPAQKTISRKTQIGVRVKQSAKQRGARLESGLTPDHYGEN